MWTVRFEGGDELARELDQLSMRVSKKIMGEALLEGAEPIRKQAGRNAPHRPGAPDIRANIGANTVRAREEMAAVAIGLTRGFAYGLPLELGTRRHPAHPFMRPAFMTHGEKALPIIAAAIWRDLAGRGVMRSVVSPAPVIGGGGGGLI